MRLVSTNNLVGVGESQTLGATSNESDIEILTQPLNPYILPEKKECQQKSIGNPIRNPNQHHPSIQKY